MAAYKSSYDALTGDLVVQFHARVNTRNTHSVQYHFAFSILATKASGGSQTVTKVANNRNITGSTGSGAAQTFTDNSSKTANWPYLGHGIKEFIIDVTSGADVALSRIKLQANGSGTTAGTSSSLNFGCELTTDANTVDEPLSCTVYYVVLSAASTVIAASGPVQRSLYYNPSSLGVLHSTNYSSAQTAVGPLGLLRNFDYTRVNASGAEFGPVHLLNLGCRDFGYSSGNITAVYNGYFLDRNTTPYLEYTGVTECNLNRLQ